MPPIPCSHCGGNFMRPTLDPDAPKLCNNCLVREEKRNPKGEMKMDNVDILIKCPRQVQIEIEELCINQGIDFTRYFLELHHGSQSAIASMKEQGLDWKNTQLDPKELTNGKPDFVTTKKEMMDNYEKTLPKNKGKKK